MGFQYEKKDEEKKSRKAVIKIIIFILFIIAAIILVRFTPVKRYLTADALGTLVDSAGVLAPLLFIFVYTIGVGLR